MLCSHARSQPACFSGRTLPSAAQQYHRRQDSAARAASWAFASTGADTATAGIAGAAQRGQIHEFDKLPSFSRAHSSSEESLVAYKQGPSGPRGRSYKKVEQRAPERIHKQENGARWDTAAGSETAQLVLEQTLQVLDAGEIDDNRLAQLAQEVSRLINSAPPAMRVQMQRHEIVSALDSMSRARLATLSHESLAIVVIAFGELESLGCQLQALPLLCDELCRRQRSGFQLNQSLAYSMLRTIAVAPSLRRQGTEVARSIIPTLLVEEATPSQLHALAMSLVQTGLSKQLAGVNDRVISLLLSKRRGMTAWQIYELFAVAGSLLRHSPQHCAKALADALVEKDPALSKNFNLPDLLYGCAGMGLGNHPLINAAVSALVHRMARMRSKAVLAALKALASLGHRLDGRLKHDMQAALEQHIFPAEFWDSAKPRVVVTMLWSLARLQLRPPLPWLDAACSTLIAHSEPFSRGSKDGMPIRDAATLVWCMGKMQLRIAELDRLFQVAEHQLPKANPQDIVCLAKGIASLEIAVPHSLDKSLDRRAAALLQDFNSQALCELLHSFGKRRTQPSRLLAAASRRICSAPGALQMRDVSELLWSFAMLQYAGPGADRALGALFKRCSELLRSEESFVLRDLTAIAWATASLEEAPVSRAHFYSQLLLRARPISSMTNHDVANMLWACAKCGAEPNEIHRFTARVEELALELKPIHITTILWAYGKLGKHPGIEVVEALLSPITNNITQIDTQGVSNTVWACGMLRHHPGPLVQAVRADLHRRRAEYSLHDWTCIAYAFTQLGEDTADVLELLDAEVERRGVQPDAQLISTIMWSAAVFEHFSLPVFRKMMRLLDGTDPARADADSLHRIHMAHLLACLVKWCTPADISPSFQMAGTPRVWMAELLAEDQSQQTTEKYRQISSCLQQLRLPHVNCHRPATSSSQAKVLKLGIVVKQPWGTQRIVAILLLSPAKLTVNTHQPLWKVLHLTACLCACGYDVLWVPWSEWEAAVARDIQEAYLTSRIQKLLAGVAD